MRRKRLQHVADTLCHMFCGWQLMFSYATLEHLGSGSLTLNAKTGACTFNDRPIASLRIAQALQSWMYEDFARHEIDPHEIMEAVLTAQLEIGQINAHERRTTSQYFGPNRQPFVASLFTTCTIHCTSRVATDEMTYTSAYNDYEEWARGWASQMAG